MEKLVQQEQQQHRHMGVVVEVEVVGEVGHMNKVEVVEERMSTSFYYG